MLVAHLAQFMTPLVVIIGDVAHLGLFKQAVAVFHFLHEAVQRLDDAVGVGNDGFLLTRRLGKVVFLQVGIHAELHAFGIHQDKLQLRRTFLVEQ